MTTKPVSFTQTITVAANSSVSPGLNGSFLRCLYSNQAGTMFTVAFDDGQAFEFDQGLAAYCAPGDTFGKVTITNPTAAALTVTLAYGQGNITDSRVSLTNSQIAIAEGGNQAVVTAAGALSENMAQVNGNTVNTGQGDPALSGVQRTYSPSRIGDSFSTTEAAATGTLVAPASNVNGIMVRGNSTVSLATDSNALALCIGTAAPTSFTSNECLLGQFNAVGPVKLGNDVFIPAGQGLNAYCTATSASWNISYKVL
jgi:hypothetical protein